MAEKMLIDASHPEETRVVVVRGNRIEEFDFESQHKKQLRGNIYLAKVTRVEPSLQAAFVDYGGNRHGFLAFSEIHPDYYQIPLADRQALLEAEAEEAAAADRADHHDGNDESNNQSTGADNSLEADSETNPEEKKTKPKRRRSRRKKSEPKVEVSDTDVASSDAEAPSESSESAEKPALDEEAQNAIEAAQPVSEEPTSDQPATDKPAPEISETAEAETSVDAADVVEIAAQDPKKDDPDIMAAIVETDDEISEEVEPSSDDEDGDDHSADVKTATQSEVEQKSDEEPKQETEQETTAKAEEETEATTDVVETKSDDADSETNDADTEDEAVEEVGASDVSEEVPQTPRKTRKQYRIQEVIKRRQILLVQIVKEERGNKGAALTTYMSLAGRYSVLMPNTARGGGISRKITNAQDRKRLKEIAQELEVPQGMGVILRTAGASRTKAEIRRDFEYLMRLWENVRELTLSSMAPCLVYEEGSLIKRSVRDLYNKDIGEVIVSGEDGYREAKDFMKMLMPSHAKVVQPYRGSRPIFTNNGIEAQLDQMMSPQVTLKSGGYLIINQTEALVSVDVNSGRSTRESSIEDTALQTNLEAAEEVSRQLKLRDLAGLVVIDFIDMEEKRNNRAVEKRLKECLKNDRARIQVGRISHFGLMEMSRQRIRASVLESTTQTCPHCEGTGLIRSDSSFALHILRGVEEQLLKNPRNDVIVRTNVENALYVLNNKRETIGELEARFGVNISIEADHSLNGQIFNIQKGSLNDRKAKVDPSAAASSYGEADAQMDEDTDVSAARTEPGDGEESDNAGNNASTNDGDSDAPRKKRRRRRRRGRGNSDENNNHSDDNSSSENSSQETSGEETSNTDTSDNVEDIANSDSEDDEGRPKKRRRRGKRGGRKNRTNDATNDASNDATGENSYEDSSEAPTATQNEGAETVAVEAVKPEEVKSPEVADNKPQADAASDSAEDEPKAKKPRRRRTKKSDDSAAPVETVAESASKPSSQEESNEGDKSANREARTNIDAIVATAPVVTSSTDESDAGAPKRTGWWRRAFKN